MEEKELSEKLIRRKTVRSFVFFFAGLILMASAWYWLRTQPKEGGMYRPLRTFMAFNEWLFGRQYSNSNTAPEFPKNKVVKQPRVNGSEGLRTPLDTADWMLKVAAVPGDTMTFALSDIKALPKTEIVFDFKCIEGWSEVTHWGGVRFSEFAKHYHLGPYGADGDIYAYTGLETPDKKYYVGIDMKSMLHPQTLLCYEMNGKPLTDKHGAPLRLIIPVKYGVKSLKRIGTIFFSSAPPKDYWAERGYDYYIGL
jgi:DMSO/TMAO reductase YedYZ molybdopterin-dependent catalytic subunit